MATKNGGKAQPLQSFVKEQITEAQKRFQGLEEEAESVLKNLATRGRESRKELEGLIQKINSGEMKLLQNPTLKQFGKRAEHATAEVRRRLDQLQTLVVEKAGVASQAQVRQITRELGKLSKKVDTLVGKKPAKSEARV